MHPVVDEFLKAHPVKPDVGYPSVLAEDPIIAQDGERVAYFRSEHHRDIDRRTVCSVHRYLSQRFEAPEWAITEACNKWAAKVSKDFASHEFKVVDDMEEMIDLVHAKCGRVRSCMVDPNKFRDPAEHPYRAYDPSHGWALAVRLKGGQVMARTILHRFPGKPYTFSRVYGPSRDGSDATSGDNLLESWLENQNIKHESDLEGATLARVEVGNKLLLPYLDTGNEGYRLHNDHLEIVDDYANDFDAHDADGYEESCPVWGGGRDFMRGEYCLSSDRVLIPLDKAIRTSLGWQHADTLNLVTTLDGMEIADFDSVKLYDGSIVLLNHHIIQTLSDGRLALRSECSSVNGQWYLTSEAPAQEPTIPASYDYAYLRRRYLVREPQHLCVTLGYDIERDMNTMRFQRDDKFVLITSPTNSFPTGTAVAALIGLDLTYEQATQAWTAIEAKLQENPASGTTIMVPIPPALVISPPPQDRSWDALYTSIIDQACQIMADNSSRRWTLSGSPAPSEWSHEGRTYTPILPPIVEQP